VIVSAITHPDMITIIRAHGLVAMPVDVDLTTLAPAGRRPRTGPYGADPRGARGAPAGRPHRPGADRRLRRSATGLLLIEDSAQAFTGVESLAPTGGRVSMVSFGMIKTASAVGGAVVAVRSPELGPRCRTSRPAGRSNGAARTRASC
jgi:dTDP-4-amino-4,6-dideoxygalactose transaminase